MSYVKRLEKQIPRGLNYWFAGAPPLSPAFGDRVGANASSAGPADGQPVHLQRWNSYSDRHRLSILATGPDALVELQIAAHHRNLGQHIRAVANERRVFQRRGDDAVLDQVSFRSGKNELAVGDVHLRSEERRVGPE